MTKIKTVRIENPTLLITNSPTLDESGFSSGAGISKRHVPYGKIDGFLLCDCYSQLKSPVLESQGYELKNRTFHEIAELFSDDYKKFEFPYHATDGVYIGAQHGNSESTDPELLAKKCNLTYFGNLEATLDRKPVIVMASSMGHFHPVKLDVQEVYEFQGYGAIAIKKNNAERIKLIFVRAGGKVFVPGNCHMTIYNLQDNPLETHDFANPTNNQSHKEFQKTTGPVLCIYHSAKENKITFKVNPKYISGRKAEPIEIALPENNWKDFLYQKSKKHKHNADLRMQFMRSKIYLVSCDETPENPTIPTRTRLETIVRNKSPDFCEMFGIPYPK